ncbi:MAG: hypothetical protein QNJ34_06365 [Xenococcaceae cyanobacterium MO_188.B29]|nr:hypothetical protein [Xenococcaceae cyanobacterium MO_188.B29]
MNTKNITNFIQLCITFSLFYITIGDIFLPQPYNDSSKQVRQDINQFLVSLFPEKEFKTLRKTEKTLEEFEQGNVESLF